MGGNEAVNKIYEAKLKKRDKITYETNEYKSIDFITQKYVEKKWMIKDSNNHKKKNKKNRKKFNKRRSEKVIMNNIDNDNDNDDKKNKKKFNKRREEKLIMNNNNNVHDNDKRESEDSKSDVEDLLNFDKAHKLYEDDKPSDWVRFTENEDKIEISYIEDGDHMMPSLLDFNEMNNFAFSDLALGNVHNDFDPININQDIMDNNINDNNDNSINKLDKAAILSMYKSDNNQVVYSHINPMIRMKSSSPFPKSQIIIANNMNIKKEVGNVGNVVNVVNDNPFRNENNYNIFNPFNYINDIVGNTGCYVYSPNVSC